MFLTYLFTIYLLQFCDIYLSVTYYHCCVILYLHILYLPTNRLHKFRFPIQSNLLICFHLRTNALKEGGYCFNFPVTCTMLMLARL